MDATSSIKQLRVQLSGEVFVQDDLYLYERYLVQIESNLTSEPNVSFEAIKSLAEAIFRHILGHERIKGEFAGILTQSKVTTYKLFQATCKALAEKELIDVEILGLGQKFFHDISEIRNSVGLISHGKDLRDTSNLKQSTIVLGISTTINFLTVILDAYEKLLDGSEMKYDDNTDFNEYLDNENEIEGISYSQALYDQDIVSYKDQLDEYNEFKEED